jgi:hypothetical protein
VYTRFGLGLNQQFYWMQQGLVRVLIVTIVVDELVAKGGVETGI